MNPTEESTLLSDGAPPDPKAHGPFAAMRRVLPSGEVDVYKRQLYNAFVLFTRHFIRNEIFVADVAQCLSMPIAITVAFLGYKWFVFRTKGNYLKEWLRCFAVYSVGFPLSVLIVLPAATTLFLHSSMTKPYAANLAGLVNSVVIACYSYFAHKKFSFKR